MGVSQFSIFDLVVIFVGQAEIKPYFELKWLLNEDSIEPLTIENFIQD